MANSSMTQPVFWVLTALAAGRRHGYEILRETSEASGGQVSLKATTLYSTLERLERDGLIASDGEEVINGRVRRYYCISEPGSLRLAQEIELMERAAAVARQRMKSSSTRLAFPRTAMSW